MYHKLLGYTQPFSIQAAGALGKKGIFTKVSLRPIISRGDVFFTTVYRRVGGLEGLFKLIIFKTPVYRRVGGLEVIQI